VPVKAVAIRRHAEEGADGHCAAMDRLPPVVELIEPLLPQKKRRFRYRAASRHFSGDERIRVAYRPKKYERLVALKD
jgi:hypothetical protein